MKNYNLSKNKSLTIAVRCDTYLEALEIVTLYKMKFTDFTDGKEPIILFNWTESQPFLCISPKYLPAQFVNHYYAKENGLEVVQFSDFLADNSLVAEAGKVNGSSGDGTVQQQDYMLEIIETKKAHEILDLLLESRYSKTPPPVGLYTELTKLIEGPYPYPDRQAK